MSQKRAGTRKRAVPRKKARPRPAPVARRQPAAARVAAPSDADDVLPPWDRGPVRAHVRDTVDGGRHLTWIAVPALALVMITVAAPVPSELGTTLRTVSLVALALLAVEILVKGRTATLAARAAHPDRQVNAVSTTFYWFMRAHRPRSMRKPAPRVRPGGQGVRAG